MILVTARGIKASDLQLSIPCSLPAPQTDNAVKFSAEGKVVAISLRPMVSLVPDSTDSPNTGGQQSFETVLSSGPVTFAALRERQAASSDEPSAIGTGAGAAEAFVSEALANRVTEGDETTGSPRLESFQQWVELKVCDQGEGMSPEAVKKLFRPFRRGNTAIPFRPCRSML